MADEFGTGGGMGFAGFEPMSVSSTTTTDIPEWLKPYAQQFLGSYSNAVFDDNGPYGIRAMPSDLNQQFAPRNIMEQGALGLFRDPNAGINNTVGSNLAQFGRRQLKQTLKGNYLDPATNPWLRKMYTAAADPMQYEYANATAPGTMAAAQRAGQMGSSAFNEQTWIDKYGLGRNLGDLAANLYGQNYQQERARQMQAEQLLPSSISSAYAPATALLGAGAFKQGQSQQQNDMDFTNALRREEWPFQLLSGFGGALPLASGGAGTSSSTQQLIPPLGSNAYPQGWSSF